MRPSWQARTEVRTTPGAAKLAVLFALGLVAFGAKQAATSGRGGDETAASSVLRAVQLPDAVRADLEPAVAEQLGDLSELVRDVLAREDAEPGEVAEALGELGRHYHAYELFEPARAAYEAAAERSPRDFRWPYLLGYLAQTEGRLEDAIALYERSLAIVPGVSPAYVRLATCYAELGQAARAEWLYREALRVDPTSSAAQAGLGELLASTDRAGESVRLLESALAESPDANRLYYPLALAYRKLGREDEARELVARKGIVGIRPADPVIDSLVELKTGERAFLLRGQAAFRAGRYQDAVVAFERAVAANPTSVSASVNLGTALGAAGEKDKAVEVFREVVALAPGNETAQFNLGMLLAAAGALADAETHLKEAALLAPADTGIRLALARVLAASGKPGQAALHFGAVAEADPANLAARLGEADALAESGRHEEALERLDALQRQAPSDLRLAYLLARFLVEVPDAELRDGPRALRLARQLFAAETSVAHAVLVADALAEEGRCEEAASFIDTVLEQAAGSGQSEATQAGLAERAGRYARDDCGIPF